MSAFAALMALSASQTRESQNAVQTALEQRQRNEELQRKKRDALERKIREEEAKLRQKRFEDDQKRLALEARREADQARLEAEQTRREEEARNALLYGPKKAKSKWPTSHSGIKEDVRRRRTEEEEEEPGMALTREEKRQRRMALEQRRTYSSKRAPSGYAKAGRRPPGRAADVPAGAASQGSGQSVKARLAALPNTLTKLNVHKRDTRTIDEILQDRAKAKNATLDGDEAREFNDWFGRGKKKEAGSTGTQSSASLAEEAPSSGANSPSSRPATQAPSKSQPKSAPGRPLHSRPALSTKSSSSTIPKVAKSSQSKSPVLKPGASGPSKKRPRSPSPPPKRRASEPEHSFSAEIWKLFGKDRSSYVMRDVLSDDEDMEADMGAVMKEEMRSARLAKREDELALEEEKRREDDKRRRKRERERQGM